MSSWLLTRFKRRPLIMASSLGMAACMFISGTATYWTNQGMDPLNQTGLQIRNHFEFFFGFFYRNARHWMGTHPLHTVVCLYVYDRIPDNTLDNDSWIVSGWHSRNRTFDIIFDGGSTHVCYHPKLRVSFNGITDWLMNIMLWSVEASPSYCLQLLLAS